MLRELFIKDWGWKLFSLLLAVSIWLTVHKIIDGPKNPDAAATVSTITFDNLPVTVVSASGDVRDFRAAPTVVKVTVSGPAGIMNTLQIGQVRAVVNLTGTNLATDSHLPVEISAPTNLTITAIDPPDVLVLIPPTPAKNP